MYNHNNPHCKPYPEKQKHVHEVQGSVLVFVEECKDKDKKRDDCKDRYEDYKYYDDKKDDKKEKVECHNHRFATVTGEAIETYCDDHYHEVKFTTDFYDDHFHTFCGVTGGKIQVGDRHVHFLKSCTSENDKHKHEFRLSTFMNDLIGEDKCK